MILSAGSIPYKPDLVQVPQPPTNSNPWNRLSEAIEQAKVQAPKVELRTVDNNPFPTPDDS